MNEGIIQFDYQVTGLATVTAQVLKPDSTIRDGQSAIPLPDTGHPGRYSNTIAITVQAGDSFKVFIGAGFADSAEYRPETSSVALKTTISGNINPDISFDITDGPAIADALVNMVVMITDISAGFSVARRIKAYTVSKNITLDLDVGFALSAGDVIEVSGSAYEGEIGEVAVDAIVDAIDKILPLPNRFATKKG